MRPVLLAALFAALPTLAFATELISVDARAFDTTLSKAAALGKQKRVYIGDFTVGFQMGDSKNAESGGLGSTGSSSVNLVAVVEGLDDATLQRVTDASYAAFVEEAAALGLEIVPTADVIASGAFTKVVAQKGAAPRNVSRVQAAASGRGGPAPAPTMKEDAKNPVRRRIFVPAEALTLQSPKGGPADATAQLTAQGKAGATLGASIVSVNLNFRFADFESRGSMLSSSAEVEMAPRMSVVGFDSNLRVLDVKTYGSALLSLKEGVLASDRAFATLGDSQSFSLQFPGLASGLKVVAIQADPAVVEAEAMRLARSYFHAVLGVYAEKTSG